MDLIVKNLHFQYEKKGAPLFENFDLTVASGQIAAILGSSGSGKSTLLRIICGLEERAQGSIHLGNRTFQQVDQNAITFTPVEKRGIGFMFQDYALFPFMTVSQNIKFGMERKDKRTSLFLEELLSLTKLTGLNHRYPHELSGGQQQRVTLARTLAARPSLLLMDEPFSSLDSNLVKDLRDELKIIIEKAGLTTLLVTHNEEDAHFMANQIVRLT